jgi:hypothetical protein
MPRSRLEFAIQRGSPFSVQMADGQVYHVPYRDYISLSPGRAIAVVYDDQDHVWVLPLLTMTGLSYKDPNLKRILLDACA